MTGVKVKGLFPQVVVNNVADTVKYYCEVYGFTLIGFVCDPPIYGMVERDGFQVHFGNSDREEMAQNEKVREGSFDLYIVVSDIDLCLLELKNKNADVIEGVVLREYGSREIVTRDCNGFTVTFGD